jgi:uncharacterized protein (TIGR02145 family)
MNHRLNIKQTLCRMLKAILTIVVTVSSSWFGWAQGFAQPTWIEYNNSINNVNPGEYVILFRELNNTSYKSEPEEFTIILKGIPTVPTGPSSQTYCSSEGKKVSDLTPTLTGNNIKWYDADEAGNVVAETATLTTGNYFASQTENGCESSSRHAVAVTITTIPIEEINDGDTNAILCAGDSITLTANIADEYLWNTGAITPSITVSPTNTATYSLTITKNGCSSLADSFTVNVLPQLTISTGTPINSTYYGANNGQITINSITGGNGGTISLILDGHVVNANFQSALTIDTLAAGTHYLLATQASGCNSDTTWFTITEPQIFTFTAHVAQNETSAGAGDGIVVIDSIYASQLLSYEYSRDAGSSWKPVLQGDSITNLPADTLHFVLRSGAVYSDTLEMIIQRGCDSIMFTIDDRTVCGDITGTIALIGIDSTKQWEYLLVSEEGTSGSVVIGGEIYNTVTIGTQTWLQRNLHYNDGEGGIYSYNGSSSISEEYGFLYDWNAANRIDGLISGWHLPKTIDWVVLNNYCGSRIFAGGKLKEKGTTHWNTPNIGATNESGFTALPGGEKNSWSGFRSLDSIGYWWQGENDPAYIMMKYDNSETAGYGVNSVHAFSIRLIRDKFLKSETWIEYFSPIEDLKLGNYKILLREKNNPTCISDTVSFTISLKEKSIATINNGATGTTICAGDSVVLTSGATIGNNWNTGAHTQSIKVSPLTTQTYTLTVTQSGCTSIADSFVVNVNTLPNATLSGDTTVTQNDPSPTITFIGVGGIPPYTFNYQINSRDILSILTETENSISVAVPTDTAGTFQYKLVNVVSASGCFQAQDDSATVTVNPGLAIKDDAPAQLCKNSVIQVTALVSGGSGNYSYKWIALSANGSSLIVPGTETNRIVSLTGFFLSAGNYEYQLTVTDLDLGYQKTKQYSIEILDNFNPNFKTFSANVYAGQKGVKYSLYELPGATYLWDVTGCTIDSGQGTSQIFVHWGEAGKGKVKVTATSGDCSYDYNRVVSIAALPTISLEPISDICFGETIANLSYTETTQWPESYSIDFDTEANEAGFTDLTDLTLPASPISIQVPGKIAAGTYNGKLTLKSKYPDRTSEPVDIQITVNPEIIIEASVIQKESYPGMKQGVVLINTMSGGTDPLVLTLNGENVTDKKSGDPIDGLNPGNYQLLLTDANSCQSAPINFTITKNSGLTYSAEPQTPETCDGTASVKVNFVGNPNFSSFKYKIDEPGEWIFLPANAIITGVTGGEHTLYIRDGGYIFPNTVSFFLQAYNPVSFDLSSKVTDCAQKGTILADNLTGGNVPYDYMLTSNQEKLGGTVTIMGEAYSWVKIGNQYWMASNLHYTDGQQADLSVNESNGYYTWDEAKRITENIDGWRLPVQSDFAELAAFAGTEENAGKNLKAVGSWNPDYSSTDQYGFNAQPAGQILSSGASGQGNECYFWTSETFTSNDETLGIARKLSSDNTNFPVDYGEKGFARSVRLIKDYNTPVEYEGTWKRLNENHQIPDVDKGTYNVVIRDSWGCKPAEKSVTLDITPPVEFSTYPPVNAKCNGDKGSVTLKSAWGGTNKGFEYNLDNSGWVKFEEDKVIEVSPSTVEHKIVVHDDSGCESVSHPFMINQPDEVTLSWTPIISKSYEGTANGSISVDNISGGNGNPHLILNSEYYQYSPGIPIEGIGIGSNQLYAIDEKGCSSELKIVTIEQIDSIRFNAINRTGACDLSGKAEMQNLRGGSSREEMKYQLNQGSLENLPSNNTIEPLSQGDYTIILNDKEGNKSAVHRFSISTSSPIDFEVKDMTNKCDYPGRIAIRNVSGGNGKDYSYALSTIESPDFNQLTWYNCNTQPEAVVTQPLYYVWIKDGNGCISEGKSVIVDVKTPVEVHIQNKRATIYYGSNHGLMKIVDISGGYGPDYQYSLDGGISWYKFTTEIIANNLPFGSYNFIAKDVKGCQSKPVHFTVSQYAELVITASVQSNASCHGYSNGEITIETITGGTETGYKYSINGQTPVSWTSSVLTEPLKAGTYKIKAFDSFNQESEEVELTITEPDEVTFTGYSFVNATCFNGTNGSFTIGQISGGNGQYTHYLGTQTLSNFTYQGGTKTSLSAGNYEYYVVDGVGCKSKVQPVVIDQPSDIVLSASADGNIDCSGNKIPILIESITGRTNNYNLFINQTKYSGPIPDGTSEPGFAAGTYNLKVIDNNQCQSNNVELTITQPDELRAVFEKTSDVQCRSGNEGKVRLTSLSGGTGKRTLFINNEEQDDLVVENMEIPNLKAGTYEFRIRDANNCWSNISPITIEQPTPISISYDLLQNVSCSGESDGEIKISITGGTIGDVTTTYSISTNNTDWTDFDPLNPTMSFKAGTYNLWAKTAQCHSEPVEVIIAEGNQISITTNSVSPVSCYGKENGSAVLKISGTVTGRSYTYKVNGGGDNDLPNNLPNGLPVDDLKIGNNTILAEDNKGCQTTHNFNVGEIYSVNFTITSPTDTKCDPNQTTGTATIANLRGGTGAGYQYSLNGTTWDDLPGNRIIGGLQKGQNNIMIKDNSPDGGCQSTPKSVSIDASETLTVDSSTEKVTCYGDNDGVLNIKNVSGSVQTLYEYSFDLNGTDWTPFNKNFILPDREPESKTIYIRSAGDHCGTATIDYTIGEPNPLIITEANKKANCNGMPAQSLYQKLEVKAQGGNDDEKYKFYFDNIQWNYKELDGKIVFNNFTEPKDFNLTVRDHKGCSATWGEISIDRTEILRFKHQSIDARCASGTGKDQINEITGGSMLGWNYKLNNDGWKPLQSSKLIVGIPAGLDSIKIKDDANCVSDFESFIIDGNGNFNVNEGKYIPPVCSGEKASFSIYDVDGETGIKYMYSMETPANWKSFTPPYTIDSIGSGSYDIRVMDANGCETLVDKLDVPVFYDPFKVSYAIDKQPICINDNTVPAQVTLTDGWSDQFSDFKKLEYQLNRDGIWTSYGSSATLPLSLKQGTNYLQIRDQIDIGNSQSVSCWSNDLEVNVNQVPKIVCNYDLDLISCSTDYTNLVIKSISGGIGSTYQYRLIGTGSDQAWITFENIEPYNKENNDTLHLFVGDYTLEIHDGTDGNDGKKCNLVSYLFTGIVKKTILNLTTANFEKFDATCTKNGSVLLKNVSGGCGYDYSGKLERIDSTTTPVSDEVVETKILEKTEDLGNTATLTDIQPEPDPKIKYNIFVTDGKGCKSNVIEVDITAPENISFDVAEPLPVCPKEKGTVKISNLKGGTNSSFEYILTTETPTIGSIKPFFTGGTPCNTSFSISNLTPGKYYLTIKDGSDCYPLTKSFTITEVEPIKVLYAYRIATDAGSSQSIAFGVLGDDATNYSIKPENATQWKKLSEITPVSYFYGSNSLKVRDDQTNLIMWDIPISDISLIGILRSQGDNFKKGMICFRANREKSIPVYEISLNKGTNTTFPLTGFSYQSDDSGIKIGDNTITITGPKGIECQSITGQFTIKTLAPGFVLTSTNPVENGQLGSIIIGSIHGGCGKGYQYKFNYDDWKDITDITQNIEINNLKAGSYWVKIKDAFGSESETKSTLLSYKLSAKINVEKPVSCIRLSDATIKAEANNKRDQSTITYKWFEKGTVDWVARTETSAEISGLPKGEYKVEITETVADKDPITAEATIDLPEPSVLSSDFVISKVSCFGGSNGAVSIIMHGGTQPYQFKHDAEYNSNNSFGQKVAGSYNFDVRDANNCTYTTPAAIVEGPIVPLTYTSTVVAPTTYNGTDGTLNVIVTGGTSPYLVQLKNSVGVVVSEKTKNITANGYEVYYEGLKAGVYPVEISDHNYLPDLTGCSVNGNITIANPEIIQIESISTIKPTCYGDENGSILLKVKGGSPITDNPEKYIFNWKYTNANNETSVIDVHGHEATGLKAGDYNITITDKVGATISVSEKLENPDPINLKIDNFQDISCKGYSNGSISISYNNRNGAKAYLNNEPILNSTIGNLMAGEYIFKVQDNKFCSDSKTQVLNEPTELLKTTITTTDPASGATSGSVMVNISGGRKNYQAKLWLVNANNTKTELSTKTSSGELVTFPGLSVGNYFVEITDNIEAGGLVKCSSTGYATLYPANVLSGKIDVIDRTGCKRVLVATAQGGNKSLGYTYEWTFNNKKNPISTTTECPVDNDGSYKVVITNGKLTWNNTITASKPSIVINQENIVYVGCKGGNDGQIMASATGGTEPYQYSWTGNITTQNLSNVIAGNYTLIVTDSKGCNASKSFKVDEPQKAIAISLDQKNTKNGTITMNPINKNEGWGNFKYKWFDSKRVKLPFEGLVATGLGVGRYYFDVSSTRTADNICKQDVVCNEEKEIILSNTGFMFDLEVQGDFLCAETQNLTLVANVYTDLQLNKFSYSWYNNLGQIIENKKNSVKNVAQGKYRLVITAPNNEKLDTTFTITDPNRLNIDGAVVDQITGKGEHNGAITLNTDGGLKPYSFNWGSGITTENRTNLGLGTYNVTVKDHNNCSVNGKYTIIELPLSVKIENPAEVVCKYHTNGVLFAKAVGGTKIVPGNYNYEWSKFVSGEWSPLRINLPELSNRGAGKYKIEVTDAVNKTVEDEFEIIPKSNLEVSVTSTNGDCKGNLGTATAAAGNGFGSYTYLWSNQANTPLITNIGGGKYDLTVTDGLGCQATASTTVEQAGELNFSETVTPYTCPAKPNGAIEITIDGGSKSYNYRWTNQGTKETIKNGNDNILDLLGIGHYSVEVSDLTPNYHCTLSRAYELVEAPLVEHWFNLIPQSVNICFENGITIPEVKLNQGGAVYSWKLNGNPVSADPAYFITEGGNYDLEITDASGCKWEKNISVDKSQFLIDAEFLLPSAPYLNDVITIVNTSDVGVNNHLSYDLPDKLTWKVWKGTSLVTDEAQVIKSTDQYISLKFVQPGEYKVELIVEKGECTKVFTKTVLVDENERPLQESSAASQPLIISFLATPNPTESDYEVTLEFSRKSPAYLYLHDYSGNFISSEPLGDIESVWKKKYESAKLRSGIYVLSLITPSERISIKLIKQ